MNYKPKPCPFCGSGDIDYQDFYNNPRRKCNNCGAVGPKNKSKCLEIADIQWNNRAGWFVKMIRG